MNEEDRNIYVVYEKQDESGNLINPISVLWNGKTFDLDKYSKKEILDQIKKSDVFMEDDVNKDRIKRINILQKQKVLNVQNNSKKSKTSLKARLVSAVVACGILLGVVGCEKQTQDVKDDSDVLSGVAILDLDQDVVLNSKEIVEKTMKNFDLLSEKYAVDGKEYFIPAEEWLTAHIYANSYDYTIQELIKILEGNPDFYSKLADNYRLFCEKQMTFNIVSDEPSLSKEFFVNEEAYNIYMNYFNTFKKAQKEPTKENKKALDDLTKEIFGLTSIDNGLQSVYEENPGVASIIGHTLTPSGMMLGLITKDTYDDAMGIYYYDKNGNLIENHGPIEMATCNDIELERLDKLNTQILSSAVGNEDLLQPWFDDLNKEYGKDNIITTKEALQFVNKVRKGTSNYKKENNSSNKNNSTNDKANNSSNTTSHTTTHSGGVVDPSTLTPSEKQEAEEKADQEFEKEYGDENAKEAAYGQGMSEAMSAIETILSRARQNQNSANSISSSEITAIANSIKNSYSGKYGSNYNSGVDVALSYGLSELESIKQQYNSFNESFEEIVTEEEYITQEELDRQNNVNNETNNNPVEKPSTSEPSTNEPSTNEPTTDQNENNNNEENSDIIIYEEVEEEYITQEELEQQEIEQEETKALTRVR